MMFALIRIALPIVLAATLGARAAHADIYTWVDASGALNVSNLTPPDDARVLKVVRTDDAAARKNEAQALADRVKQLEDEVAMATRQPPPMGYAPPPLAYAPPPAPPIVQYIIEAPQPAPQYVIDQPAPYSYGSCDPSWYGCSYGWGPGFYPSSVIVVSAPPFRPTKPGFGRFRPHPSPVTHVPMQTSLIQPLSTPVVHPLVPATAPAVHAPTLRRG